MAEIYRVEKGSEEWKYKAYDYIRTDAFCCGQNIPIELEFGQDESKDDLQAILLTQAGSRLPHRISGGKDRKNRACLCCQRKTEKRIRPRADRSR